MKKVEFERLYEMALIHCLERFGRDTLEILLSDKEDIQPLKVEEWLLFHHYDNHDKDAVNFLRCFIAAGEALEQACDHLAQAFGHNNAREFSRYDMEETARIVHKFNSVKKGAVKHGK